ncbi:MAG: PEGA domain-containing protein [Magnetococcales bacterium]|nr:PEGA domain-containing protein [Magnetococcales bacterium]
MSRLLTILKELERDFRASPAGSSRDAGVGRGHLTTGIRTMPSRTLWGGMILVLILLAVWNITWNTWILQSANAEIPPPAPSIFGPGDIQAITDPIGAGILMDGHFVGVTPLRFDWEPGTHRLEIKKYGYHDLVVDITIEKGRRMEVDLKLYPLQQNNPHASESTTPVSVLPSPVAVKPLTDPAKPSAWVVKPGQGEPKETETLGKEKDEGRVYTVQDTDSQKITGRVQEVARSNMPFRYSIQVGAFLDRDSALRMAASWRRKGYDAYVLELYGIKDPSRLWQSVRIGRFDNILVARRYLDTFRAKEKSDGYLALSDSFAPPTATSLSTNAVHGAVTSKGAGKASNGTAEATAKGNDRVPQGQVAAVPSHDLEKTVPGNAIISAGTVAPGMDLDTKSLEKNTKPAVDGADGTSTGHTKEKLGFGPVAVSVDDGRSRQANGVPYQAEIPAVPTPVVKDLSVDLNKVGDLPATKKVPEVVVNDNAGKTISHEGDALTTAKGPTIAGSVSTTLDPKAEGDVSTWYSQAVELEKNNKSEGAIELYNKILARDSGHLLARQRLARAYVETGKVSEALNVLKPAVSGRDSRSLASSDPNFSAFLAALYQRQEEHRKAAELYEALLSLQPVKGIWQMGLAISQEKLNDPVNALKNYEKALESGDLSTRLRAFVQKRVRALKP